VSARSKTGNQLLAALSAADFSLLEPDLEAVDLPLRRQLERRNQPVEKVYFIDSGLGSMVMNASPNHMVEVGIIGSEGMTGLAVLLGAGAATYETFIQTAGTGRRISAEKLRLAIAESPSLHQALLRYVHVLITQMAYTALANARYKLEERLARWLLMADDRSQGEPVRLTHEFLSVMLGTRRAGVTVTLNEFQKRGLVQTRRGAITIMEREELKEAANGSYGAPEVEYRQLFERSDYR
jgi:CRP-like cAMP-binding protein